MKQRKLSPTELSYLAGIFDGEGTIGIERRTPLNKRFSDQYLPYLVVGNTSLVLMEILVDAFGGAYHPYKVIGNRKPMYRWELHSDAAIEPIRVVAPYLRMKTEQAKIVLEFVSARSQMSGGRSLGVSQDEMVFRHSFWERIRVLNHRGTTKVTIHPVRKISREVGSKSA